MRDIASELGGSGESDLLGEVLGGEHGGHVDPLGSPLRKPSLDWKSNKVGINLFKQSLRVLKIVD